MVKCNNIKRYIILGIVGGLLWSFSLEAGQLSENYKAVNVAQDSGGKTATSSSYSCRFQAVSPTLKSISTGASHQLITGTHFSSDVYAISGYAATFDKGSINLVSSVNEGMMSKVGFQVLLDSSPTNLSDDTDYSAGGWNLNWASATEVPVTSNVQFLSRGFDGLTWGPWFTSAETIVVDNEVPVFSNIAESLSAFSPNSPTSIGLADTTTLSFTVNDSYPSSWQIQLKDSENAILHRTYSGGSDVTVSQVWDGKNSVNNYVDEGGYFYELTIADQAGNSAVSSGNIVTVDNTSPVASELNMDAIAYALNSTNAGLTASWNITDNLDATLLFDVYYQESGGEWVQDVSQTASSIWVKPGLDDSKNYVTKIETVDDAQNPLESLTNTVFTPDRTAPEIKDQYAIDLNQINGVEDVGWTFNLTNYKQDNYSSGADLDWAAEMYFESDGPGLDADNVLQSISLENATVSNGYQDTISFVVSPNANTDLSENGNVYGFPDAYIKLRLEDVAGNHVTEDIKIIVAAVNDVPVFLADIGDGVYRDPISNQLIYSIKFDEDTGTSENQIELDSFISDVDNLKSAVTWSVANDVNVNFLLRGAVDNHEMVITPDDDWYGDESVVVSVYDGDNTVTQPMIVRIWPINDAPQISPSLPSTLTVNEDIDLSIDLSAYESDTIFEDQPSDLKWTVKSGTLDASFVDTLTGQSSVTDLLTFEPVTNKYGSTEVTLVLTDTDQVAQAVFSSYDPNPLSVEQDVDLVWTPVNDPPQIEDNFGQSIADKQDQEDSNSFQIELTEFQRDVEDVVGDLTWTADMSAEGHADLSLNPSTRILTVTPLENAWGTANIVLTLTDKDEDISFSPYTAAPVTTTKNVLYTLTAVNDTPTFNTMALTSLLPLSPTSNRVKTTDMLSAIASGYNDVGYVNGVRDSTAVGDEYEKESISALNHVQNQKGYRVKWYVDNALHTETVFSPEDTYSLQLSPDFAEGKQIRVEVFPNDGVTEGNSLIDTMDVNNRPVLIAEPSYPIEDAWVSTNNITVTWNLSADADSDDIAYRIKFWRDIWASTPPEVDIDTAVAYDTGWVEDVSFQQIDKALMTFTDGSYYWTAFSGNKYSSASWDHRMPSWVRKFNIDTVEPELPSADYIVGIGDLLFDPSSNQRSDKFQIIFGDKEAYSSVWLELLNEQLIDDEIVTTSSYTLIINHTPYTQWTHQITYPPGTTTFNIWLTDRAENRSLAPESFVIAEDTTPPSDPLIANTDMTLIAGVQSSISSQNYYALTGTKDEETSIWYTNRAVTTYTDETTFSFNIYPDNPSGNIVSQDRFGNVSNVVPVDVQFYIGNPTVTLVQGRDRVNLTQNLQDYSQSIIDEVSSAQLQWSSERETTSWDIVASGNIVLASGDTISEGTTTNVTIAAADLLIEGNNALTLNVRDLAHNVMTTPLNVELKSQPPTVNVSNTNYFLLNGQWHVSIIGYLDKDETIDINGVPVVVDTKFRQLDRQFWVFRNFDNDLGITDLINLETQDIEIKVIDQVYNENTITHYSHSDYASIASTGYFDIVDAYDSLPENVLRILSKKLSRQDTISLSILSLSDQRTAFEFVTDVPELFFPDQLQDTVFVVYAEMVDHRYESTIDLRDHNVQIQIPFISSMFVEKNKLVAVRFDPVTSTWIAPEVDQGWTQTLDTYSVRMDQTGIWALAELKSFASTLATLRVYPNPWRPSDNQDVTGTLSTGIVFDKLTDGARIEIYTVSGQLIHRVIPQTSTYIWDGNNDGGAPVFSGVYLYVVQDETEKKTGKLTIIR